MAKRVAAVRISPLLRMGWRLHRWLYRLSGGRFGSRLGPWSTLLLVTRGRKSGERRTAGLNYLTDDGRLVVVGSYAGEDRHPAWWLNLLADPRAEVQVGNARWARVMETDPSYAEYQRRTTRRIPVVVLERIADA